MRWLGLQLESIHSRDSHSLPHSPHNNTEMATKVYLTVGLLIHALAVVPPASPWNRHDWFLWQWGSV